VSAFRRGFERALEGLCIVMLAALAVVVTAGVAFRYAGYALAWYDELASILLAWVTYSGAALGALKRAHIGVPELVAMMPPRFRVPVAIVAEASVFAFFVLLAWLGYAVLEILAGDTLVSMPAVSVAWAQSVIPVCATLFIVAQALALPETLREAARPEEPA
jgi:TRAP-type C4-dicarboxylate transport system permease small subunit